MGYIIAKYKFVPENSETVLSKLENIIFLPSAVMLTFISDCTVEKITQSWTLIIGAFILGLLLIPLSFLGARCCFKDRYFRNITTYGLAFPNFAYMGLAIIPVAFPEYVFEYTIFTLPFWFMVYAWGTPVLLIGEQGERHAVWSAHLKTFINPMMIGMMIGLIIGLTGISGYLPNAVTDILSAGKSCMSPMAMLLTGMTIAKVNISELLKKWRIYIVALIKLLVYPLLFLLIFVGISHIVLIDKAFLTCAFCVVCMPMGLNAIVVPASYGKDTTDAAGMALVTHLFSVITIPLLFMFFHFVL